MVRLAKPFSSSPRGLVSFIQFDYSISPCSTLSTSAIGTFKTVPQPVSGIGSAAKVTEKIANENASMIKGLLISMRSLSEWV